MSSPSLSQMKCFFVNVRASDITTATLANLAAGCSTLSLGITSDIVSQSDILSGIEITDIPVGKSRTIEIFGVLPANSASSCPASAGDAAKTLFSSTSSVHDIYLLGSSTRDLEITSTSGEDTATSTTEQTIEISITSTYDSTTAQSLTKECKSSNSQTLRLSTSNHSSSTCVISVSGALKCFGSNYVGQLGLGDTLNRGAMANEMGSSLPAVSLGSGRTASQISLGYEHSCALLDNGTMKCWGMNGIGQLGLGNIDPHGLASDQMGNNLPAVNLGTNRTTTQVSCGSDHSCALLDNGTMKCWGMNMVGQLGLGNTSSHGMSANEMGDDLPAVNLGDNRTATQVSTGNRHTCALLDNSTVKCWGLNASGQLGLGDGVNRGDEAGEMGNNLPAINLGAGRTATQIMAGQLQTCAILDTGSIKCWGQNDLGQLGLGDTASRGSTSSEMGDSLPTVSLGTGRTVTQIKVGIAHVCALLDNGTIKCWGEGNAGKLGLGDTVTRGDQDGEMGNNLPAIDLGTNRTATRIGGGGEHTCALLDNGTVKCWGWNLSGQLGLGDTFSRGDAGDEMGNNLSAIDLGFSSLLNLLR